MKPTHDRFTFFLFPALLLAVWAAAVVASLVTLGGMPVAAGARPERVLQPERRAPACAFSPDGCAPPQRLERSAP